MDKAPATNSQPETMRIDVDAVLRDRLPRHYRLIPRGLIRYLERTICQDDLNRLLTHNSRLQGSAFCRGVLADLGVSYDVAPEAPLPAPNDSRVIYVSNHPLGGLDGIALIAMIAERHGREPWFLVNDLLMAIPPLRPVFLPVNKHGRQNRDEVGLIDEAMRSDRPVIIFPAGLVSRRQPDGTIADLEWKKTFINYAIRYQRDIIPMHFDGKNSQFFYKFAKLRTRIGLKFNIEMIYLPREIFRAANSRFTVKTGARIPWTSLRGGSSARAEAARIKETVYNL